MSEKDFLREYLRYVTGNGLAALYALDNLANSENKIVVCDDFLDKPLPLIAFDDGSFRVIRKSGLLQYRFMFGGKQYPVYGHSKEECYIKRAIFIKKLV